MQCLCSQRRKKPYFCQEIWPLWCSDQGWRCRSQDSTLFCPGLSAAQSLSTRAMLEFNQYDAWIINIYIYHAQTCCSCSAVIASGGILSHLTLNRSQLGLVSVSLIPVLASPCKAGSRQHWQLTQVCPQDNTQLPQHKFEHYLSFTFIWREIRSTR